MKKYLFPLIIFSITYLVALVIYKIGSIYHPKEITTFITKIFLSGAFISYTLLFIKNKSELFHFSKATRIHLLFVLLLALFFILNNYYLSDSVKIEYLKTSMFTLLVINFILNSFFEEFAYRGFIQSYVNQKITTSLTLTQGNIFASILMTLSHFGFFMIMDTFFAITSILLVFIFSITMGYIRDNKGSIWFSLIVHTFLNFIHIYMNL